MMIQHKAMKETVGPQAGFREFPGGARGRRRRIEYIPELTGGME